MLNVLSVVNVFGICLPVAFSGRGCLGKLNSIDSAPDPANLFLDHPDELTSQFCLDRDLVAYGPVDHACHGSRKLN